MTDAEKREAAHQFINRWMGRGNEDEDGRSYWLEFLSNVMGMENPTERVNFEKKVSIPEGKETEEGNSYEQYLQMMLVLKSKEELSMRALDLVEMNLRSGMEKTFFRADACVSGADFDMTCYLRRGIRYQYHIVYQYQ